MVIFDCNYKVALIIISEHFFNVIVFFGGCNKACAMERLVLFRRFKIFEESSTPLTWDNENAL